MIINCSINTDVSINNLMDLHKLKVLEEEKVIKLNVSQIARELNVDRRTARKYIDGYKKSITRNRKSQFDDYYDIIKELLENNFKIFRYKSSLYRYMCDIYKMDLPESSFRRYITKTPEFNEYFNSSKSNNQKGLSPIRFETPPGKQAQVDWKESMNIILASGEEVEINIFVYLLSYSRFRVYRISLSRRREILKDFLVTSFELCGGVPDEIVFDNMTTVMDDSRTQYKEGKVNDEFSEFAKDMGFRIKPCIAARAQTKGKVESPMRILDDLYAYNGDLTYEELVLKVADINNRENARFHESYQTVPILALEKEKDALRPLANKEIRRHHKIKTKELLVNKSSMISYNSNLYSVPPKYISKKVKVQTFDNQIHVYYNTQLIAIHDVSSSKMNYQEEHYKQIVKITLPFDETNIEELSKNNLKIIGARYEQDWIWTFIK